MTVRCVPAYLMVALALALAPGRGIAAQSPRTPAQQALTGTWYLLTTGPKYDTTLVPTTPRPSSGPPQLVPRDMIRFADGPFPVPARTSAAYPKWVELNPRDSIAIAFHDSVVAIVADGAPVAWWYTDGVARQEILGAESVRTVGVWKKDVLVLERGFTPRGGTVRRLRVLKDSTLELTFPGIVRHPDFPKKYIFSRVPPAVKP
jgi:hypothetical protein